MVEAARPVRLGVLALQGSFREHVALLRGIAGVEAFEVRTKKQLESCCGLIIPGGESTTMALVAEQWGMMDCLREFARAGHPVWGTCAGLIFLADRALGQKQGGQPLLGGLDVLVHRNFFGAQINSFEMTMPSPNCLQQYGRDPFRGVFIRAPAILEYGKGVEVLSEYQLTPHEAESAGRSSVVVAVKQGSLLATAFHPELTGDSRWHQLFVDMTRDYTPHIPWTSSETADVRLGRTPNIPADMPVFGQEHICA